jgi:demethylmenaquinone methyltransferase/2-methoxy-6-polyprenyl-1,4-benzoquinol methylase
MTNVYSESYVKSLFDEMARTYGLVHMVSSLGFAYFWRRVCVRGLDRNAVQICDLMAGGGECLRYIKNWFGETSRVDLVDFSKNLCLKAQVTIDGRGYQDCTIYNCSVLELPVPPESYGAVVSTFGLKTLTEQELVELAREIKHVLKPGGKVSLLEFSMPENRFIRFFNYMWLTIFPFWVGLCWLIWITIVCSGRILKHLAIAKKCWRFSRRVHIAL